jgi:phenylpropionate dioxygenase-like ring-hydroxylating dioxygenase large terminal subunit
MQTVVQPTLLDDILPAGGDDSQRFDPREAWYPVYYERDLDRNKPTPFTLLGEDLVIWWEAKAQTWRVYLDRCPHRAVPLSPGRINSRGELECPYHGWSFAAEGECTTIPQQAAGRQAQTSPRACVRNYPTIVRQGLLFVYPGEVERSARVSVPTVTPADESFSDWTLIDTFRDLPYDATTALENVLDPSHLPYTHHGSVGNRDNAAAMDLQILTSDRQGFTGIWPEGPRKGKLGTQNTVFIAPNLMWHDLTSKQFGRTLTVVYVTPTRPGECRIFARFPFQFPSKIPQLIFKLTPRWYSHLGQNNILEDDQIFLHYQERYLAADDRASNYAQACFMPTEADRFVIAFRKWIDRYQSAPFPGVELPPPQSTDRLLDRYHSHTQNCRSCRDALSRIQKIRQGSAIAVILAIATVPLSVALSLPLAMAILQSATIVLGSLLYWQLSRLQQRFLMGNLVPSRNQ